MSLLHTIINSALMKGRVFYDPVNPKDYVAARSREIASTKYARPPKGVEIRQEPLGGVPAEWLSKAGNLRDCIVLYIHGGGFATGSSEARRSFTTHVADKLGLDVVSIDYRLAPEHPFPAGPDDCLAAYRALLEKCAADKIVVVGESAGGNLVLSLLLQAKAAGLPFPAATFAFSPTVQYDQEFASYRENLPTDSIVTNLSDEVCYVYLRSRDETVLTNPVAAPLYGDFTGCTPVVITVSTTEVLRDDALLLFDKLKEQSVTTKLYLREGMMHTWIIVPSFKESKKDLKIIGDDLHRALAGTLRGADEPISLR